MTGGVAAVQARIAEIRAYVEPAAVAVASTSSATASSASSATSVSGSLTAGTDFAAALAQLTGAAGADLGTVPANALSTTVTGQDLVEAAKKYLGTPYVWGGESLAEGGLDCSGLVLRSLADLGITSGVPRVARDQATLGQEVPSLDQALPGDLIVLNGGKHIGIYVGDGQMIDAPKPGKSVTIRDVYAEPTTIRRVLPQAAATPTAAPASAALSSALASTAAGQNALALLTGSAGSTAASGSLTQALGALGSGSAGAGTSTSSLLTSLWGAAS
ncbi:C40 family peptidase [Cellulomonas sp. PS-H5]|uniref:C40 family peptidase n=1 Tax=Cellulomonas sp. PS-H5 TaxID=2820400 RepID=UPI001C4E55D6|nr:C40 family peptidase [Cellulomonas sp. PS-H5]MBW0256439.1 C40 family peptidase [Cellulomonas sp. PS-H5]